MTTVRVSRQMDSIWVTADLEYGDPYEDDDEAGWFRDRQALKSKIAPDEDRKLMTLVPGWDEAKRAGWKAMGGSPGGPAAYRGTGDRFEVIVPKHVHPGEDGHWDGIRHRWIRYSQGEGGIRDPYVMHAETFRDAIDDRKLHRDGWNIYRNEYDPQTEQFHRVVNDQYPYPGGAEHYGDIFEDDQDGLWGPGYFNRFRALANKHRLAEGEA